MKQMSVNLRQFLNSAPNELFSSRVFDRISSVVSVRLLFFVCVPWLQPSIYTGVSYKTCYQGHPEHVFPCVSFIFLSWKLDSMVFNQLAEFLISSGFFCVTKDYMR